MDQATERLIHEVRQRPVLYDQSLSPSLKKELKPGLWREVAQQVVTNWDYLTEEERQIRVVDIQKRWRTLRDNFKRELRYQEEVESGDVPAGRRQYRHFDQLLFLAPYIQKRKSIPYFHILPETSLDASQISSGNPIVDETLGFDLGPPEDNSLNYSDEPRTKVEEEEFETMGYDPDEMFFLSMLPVFKKMTDKQKSLAKVKITQLMHEIAYDSS